MEPMSGVLSLDLGPVVCPWAAIESCPFWMLFVVAGLSNVGYCVLGVLILDSRYCTIVRPDLSIKLNDRHTCTSMWDCLTKYNNVSRVESVFASS